MNPLHDDPRLVELLQNADAYSAQLRSSEPSEQPVIMRSLDAVHRDIGRYVHERWVQDPDRGSSAVEDIEELEELEPVEPIEPPRRHSTDPNAWVASLQDLLALVQPPLEEDHPIALGVESARVQWATTDLRERWPSFPIPIQQALLGMFAARSRWLQQNLPVPDGAERALRRLERYRRDEGLARVVGLSVGASPESDSWPGDAQYWWEMLAGALTPAA
ncbi:MAG: hypothetical protein EA397_02975 [Deltaproteobacteria bacterium]|nr:MAG: hypothetical protein EA397_02975 [Deltaproteobacteria bacterium]